MNKIAVLKEIVIADLFCCGNCLHCGSYSCEWAGDHTLPDKYCVNYEFDGLTNKQRMIDID